MTGKTSIFSSRIPKLSVFNGKQWPKKLANWSCFLWKSGSLHCEYLLFKLKCKLRCVFFFWQENLTGTHVIQITFPMYSAMHDQRRRTTQVNCKLNKLQRFASTVKRKIMCNTPTPAKHSRKAFSPLPENETYRATLLDITDHSHGIRFQKHVCDNE